MTVPSSDWGMIHPSVYSHAAALLRWVEATPRPHGALRYRCPVTDSFVCVTDDATLAALDKPRARLRCLSCGEVHLLTQDGAGDAAIVAARAEP
jgi:hypothetical protein